MMIIPASVIVALLALPRLIHQSRERSAFLSSAIILTAMMTGAAGALYPTLLPASSHPALNITIYNAAAGRHVLSVGLLWWTGGILLAVAYVVFVYRMFREKVLPAASTG